jgi:ribosomal-protein-alanine N-acetyltransferase
MNEYTLDYRNIFIKGKKIHLISLSENEVNNTSWYSWFNDEEICKTLQKHYYPNSINLQKEFLLSSSNDKSQLILGIYSIKEKKLIGVTSLYAIDFINSKAGFSIVIGEKKFRNLLIFVEIAMLVFNHGFNTLNLNRIYGGSISEKLVDFMCKSLGCEKEGVSKSDIFKEGKYHDSFQYGILRNNFKIK